MTPAQEFANEIWMECAQYKSNRFNHFDNEKCVSMIDQFRNEIIDKCAKIARMFPRASRQDLFEHVEKQILALKTFEENKNDN